MAPTIPSIPLNDLHSIPQLGFGTWKIDDDKVAGLVRAAVEAGYRHIDTAQGYDNERGVGQGVRECGLPREEIFVTSKMRTKDQPYDKAMRSIETSLKTLGLDYLDMFLIHWPVPAHDTYPDAWRAFVEMRKSGLVRSIGVSNFLAEHIERILDATGEVPAVNQIEVHPEYQQLAVRDFHERHDIRIESYSPLGHSEVLDNPTIKEIATKHGKSPAQAIIRWHLQQGLIVIPKSTHAERIRENIDVFDFELDADDLKRIAGLDRPDGKVGNDPATNNDLW